MMNRVKKIVGAMAYAQTLVELLSLAAASATVHGARIMFFKNPIKRSRILLPSFLNCFMGWVAKQSNKPRKYLDYKTVKAKNFTRNHLLKVDFMLNLLFQHSNWLAQEINEVHMVRGAPGSLEQADWSAEKVDLMRCSFFWIVCF